MDEVEAAAEAEGAGFGSAFQAQLSSAVSCWPPVAGGWIVANTILPAYREAGTPLHPRPHIGYTVPVTSKKGVIGCKKSEGTRHKAAPRKVCGFFNSGYPFWRPEWEGASPAGNAQRAPVFLPRSGCRLNVRSWSAVVHKARLEINMAQIIAHPRAHTERVIQTRVRGRLPKSVISLRKVRSDLSMAEFKAHLLQRQIAATQDILARLDCASTAALSELVRLQSQTQMVKR